MDLFQRRCTVSGTLRIILFASLIAGIAPLKFEKVHNGWRVRTSKAASVYGKLIVVCLCILACSNVTSALYGTFKPFNLRTTQNLVTAVCILVMMLPMALVASFSGMERMNHMVNHLAQLETINRQLYQLIDGKANAQKEWKKFVFVIFLLSLGIFTNITEYAIFINQVAHDQRKVYLQSLHVFYYILIEYIQLISIQFLVISSMVLYSFRLFNSCLKSLLKKICYEAMSLSMLDIHAVSGVNNYTYPLENNNNTFKKTMNSPRNKISDTCRHLALMYCSLCDVVQTFSENYGLLLALQLLDCLLLLIVTLYHLFIRLLFSGGEIYDAAKVSELYLTFLQFIWLCYHVSNIIIVIEPCHRTHREMQVTKILIGKLMRHMPTSQHEFNSELTLFYRYLMMYDVKYAPLKMFTLDRRLFTTILGSMTTYLVVVLSF